MGGHLVSSCALTMAFCSYPHGSAPPGHLEQVESQVYAVHPSQSIHHLYTLPPPSFLLRHGLFLYLRLVSKLRFLSLQRWLGIKRACYSHIGPEFCSQSLCQGPPVTCSSRCSPDGSFSHVPELQAESPRLAWPSCFWVSVSLSQASELLFFLWLSNIPPHGKNSPVPMRVFLAAVYYGQCYNKYCVKDPFFNSAKMVLMKRNKQTRRFGV